jgi:RND superfamily putative drug exporter
MYDRLARLATRRARAILTCTLILVGLALFYSHDVTDRLETGGTTDPGTESMRAARLLDLDFPLGSPNLVLLVRAGDGGATVDDPGIAQEGVRLAQRLAAEPSIAAVASYWQVRSPVLRGADGRSALVLARIRGTDAEVDRIVGELAGRYRGAHGPVEVSVGGSAAVSHSLNTTAHDDITRAELIGIPLTAIVLMIVFRSVIAALLPLLVGGVAMIGTIASLKLVSEFTDVSVFALNLTTGLSLGLATDYALFIVQRHRDELRAGRDPAEAVRGALNTAGRTVLLSSATVAVAISTMLVFPMYFLRSFAYAGVMVAVLAAAAAVVALPAGLILLGERVNAWNPGRLLSRALPAGGWTAVGGWTTVGGWTAVGVGTGWPRR